MSKSRGASAPTSGTQDHVTVEESLLNRAIAVLRYGSIGVTLWHAMSFARDDQVGCVSRAHHHRYRVGERLRGQRLPLRSPPEVGGAGTLRVVPRPGLVRHQREWRRRDA
jgi:hypothetical protein